MKHAEVGGGMNVDLDEILSQSSSKTFRRSVQVSIKSAGQ